MGISCSRAFRGFLSVPVGAAHRGLQSSCCFFGLGFGFGLATSPLTPIRVPEGEGRERLEMDRGVLVSVFSVPLSCSGVTTMVSCISLLGVTPALSLAASLVDKRRSSVAICGMYKISVCAAHQNQRGTPYLHPSEAAM
jgi:hypothetical protein